MDCRQVGECLSAYLDGELPPPQADRVREHLDRCPRCADEYEGLMRLGRVLETCEAPQADIALARRIRRAAESTPARVVRLEAHRFGRALSRLAAALMFGIGIAAGLLVGNQAGRPALNPSPVGQATPVDLDILAAAPTGSLADVVLASLDANSSGGER